MTDKKNTKKAPNLRFKGFTDDWEERKLGKIVEFYSGLTYSPDNIISKGGTFVLRSSNVKNGELINADNVYVDSSFVNSSNVQIGDIVVVVRNGSRNLIGKHAQVKNYMENTVIGAFMTGIRAKEPNYINALLNTQQFKIEINKNLGATINQITTGAFKKMQFSITPNIEEQHEIGSFFDKLDNCITLHQRKLDQLKQLKEALLQQMFPGKGETVPKLRFAGFEGDWEERKLGDIFLYKQGLQVPVENQFTKQGDNRHRFIRIVDLTTANEEPRYIEYSGHNTVSSTDLFMVRYGQPGVIGYGYEGVIANNLFKLIPKIKINNLFFKYILNFMYPKINSLSTSTTMPAISFKSLDILDVRHPDIKEQEKNGIFFKELDSIITLHKRKLDQIKNMKQVLLENMFI